MSTRLSVKDFSCIQNAEIELANLTVLIGPSASGKSVLSKLMFFFNDLLVNQFNAIEDRKDVEYFKEMVKERFKEWFPVDAWGGEKFCIEFEAGPFQVRLTRIEYRKKLGENMRVWFSSYFEDQFKTALDSLKSVDTTTDAIDIHSIDMFWRVQAALRESLQKSLKNDFHELQTFIPAGRSFFTSVGKSIAAFEHGRILDPLILRFGRFYAALKDRGSRINSLEGVDPKWVTKLNALMGGKLVSERSKEYLHASDGRKIPISALSSGQQELMPLIMALQNRAGTGVMKRFQQLIFIEEPEAHLFPASQSALVEIFGAFLLASKGRSKLFITTHSPYVLAKINNLIKAKEVAGRKGSKKYSKVDDVISDGTWIDGAEVNAYAISDGVVMKIQDIEDGMIEASYLDDVSGQIANEFSRLLAVEYAV